MASQPPVPSASFPIPPPLAALQLFDPRTGKPTPVGLNFLTQLWAGIQGGGGTIDQIAALQAAVAIIFGLHGDGTLSAAGVLTVTKTNGTPFGFFATNTDAGGLTGTLSQAKVTNLSTAVLVSALGPPTAGQRRFVSDATVTTFASVVVGGGTNFVPVFGNGAAWCIG